MMMEAEGKRNMAAKSDGEEEMAQNKTASHHPNAISSLFDPLEPRAHNSLKWNISESLFRFTSRAGCFYFSSFFRPFLAFFSSFAIRHRRAFRSFLIEAFNVLKIGLAIYATLLRCSPPSRYRVITAFVLSFNHGIPLSIFTFDKADNASNCTPSAHTQISRTLIDTFIDCDFYRIQFSAGRQVIPR